MLRNLTGAFCQNAQENRAYVLEPMFFVGKLRPNDCDIYLFIGI
jgi:hypothetical protein